jgi:predicted amidohydrolase YtcJ
MPIVRWTCFTLCAALPLFALSCARPPELAELILHNGRIVTLDESQPEVRALAARAGEIVALGSDDEVLRLRGPATEVIDLDGRLAVPGFIEGHAHFTGIGQALMNVDLRPAKSWQETVALVTEAARNVPAGQWILGRGWHQEKWEQPPIPSVEGYPTHDLLTREVPDHPVLITHASGHASLANARALELAGIDAATSDPPGGKILRDVSGRPTGVLRETAEELAFAAYREAQQGRTAEQREAVARREIELADAECLSKGITSFQDAGSGFETIDRMREMAEQGRIGVRLWVMLSEPNDALEKRIEAYRIVDAADRHLTVRAIKRAIDGALGSHGAWLLEPYSDLPGTAGLNTAPLDDLRGTARIALEHGFQFCVHAIGDRGNRETLDLFESAFEGRTDGRELRWRIEHAQHLSAEDIPRFAGLGVIASMQGVHCTSDGPWVSDRLGEDRARDGAYVWRALIDSGAVVSNGTDAPVEDVDPIAGFYASVTRRMPDGELFYPEQRMTRMEALRSYTLNAAHAAFEEGSKGSLALGKLADVTVLSRDILEIPERDIPGVRVVYTIVGGELKYVSPDA